MLLWLGEEEYTDLELRARGFKKRTDAVLEYMRIVDNGVEKHLRGIMKPYKLTDITMIEEKNEERNDAQNEESSNEESSEE